MMLCRFENDEPQVVKGPLRMPFKKHMLNANLQDAQSVGAFAMQTWDMTFHGFTSDCFTLPLSWHMNASRSLTACSARLLIKFST